MDAALCGRSELTFEFELFAIRASVSGLLLFLVLFCLAALVQLDICLLGLYLLLPFVSIIYPLSRETCGSQLGYLLRLSTSAIFRLSPGAW